MKFEDGKGGKGYTKASFEDSWKRYTSPSAPVIRNSETFPPIQARKAKNLSETLPSSFGCEIPPAAVNDEKSFGVSDKGTKEAREGIIETVNSAGLPVKRVPGVTNPEEDYQAQKLHDAPDCIPCRERLMQGYTTLCKEHK
jgi:hypothetical protein